MGDTSLSIFGDIGTIWATGDFNNPTNKLIVNGNVKMFKVGRNLNTGVSFARNVGQVMVAGTMLDSANINIVGTKRY